MEQETKKPEAEPVSAFDELNANVEELRSKLKSLCEDPAVLVRKIKGKIKKRFGNFHEAGDRLAYYLSRAK